MSREQVATHAFSGPPESYAAAVPPSLPLVFLGGNDRQAILATHYEAVSFAEFASLPCVVSPYEGVDVPSPSGPFQSGYIGALPFSNFSPFDVERDRLEALVYRVKGCLVFDRSRGLCQEYREQGAEQMAYRIDVREIFESAAPVSSASTAAPLYALRTDDEYRSIVEAALEDIRNGRYYQINLLRRFTSDRSLSRQAWLARLQRLGGPFSGIIEDASTSLISFSPERFFKLTPTKDGMTLKTEPIKGTSPRCEDEDEDRRLGEKLTKSDKDRAELNMIVDLLRNDLNSVCERGSVVVDDPGSLRKFATVHHLQASIHGRLRPQLRYADLLGALCPGGSITGAPKREVMRAIAEYEGESRRFFMGSFFCRDQEGSFDSSILIRTVEQRALEKSFSYAAGSGIVVKSQAELERLEVQQKCRIITDHLETLP